MVHKFRIGDPVWIITESHDGYPAMQDFPGRVTKVIHPGCIRVNSASGDFRGNDPAHWIIDKTGHDYHPSDLIPYSADPQAALTAKQEAWREDHSDPSPPRKPAKKTERAPPVAPEQEVSKTFVSLYRVPGLEDDYVEVERNCAWLQELRGGERSGQFYRVSQGLSGYIRNRSLSQTLTPDQYRLRLSEARRFLLRLRLALGSEQTDDIWFHRSGERVTGIVKDSEEFINNRSLLTATAYYLARPWMQHNEIDWILLDALVYGEIVGTREAIFSGEAIGKINWAYGFAEGNVWKAVWIRLLMDLSIWTVRYILPVAVIAALLLLGYQTAAIVAGGLYILYLAGRFVLWPRRYRRKRSRWQEAKRWQDWWGQMIAAYGLCEPPVISPTILREQLSKPTEVGPLFSGAVLAVLDRIIARDRDVFLPLESLAEIDD